MKTLRFLILGWLALAGVCHAQTTSPVIAEAITPEIQALADGLQDDPVRIFNYVHDHIRFVFYFGARKGAELTLLEKSGNDFDQSSLLVAMLRAAGYTNAAYQFGWMVMPYDNPDGSDRDIQHWLGLSEPGTANPWNTVTNYLRTVEGNFRFFPNNNYAGGWPSNYWGFQRVWVTLPSGGTTNYLDPSFKVSEPFSGINLTSAMGFSSNSLMSVAGGTDTGNYASNLNEAAIRGALTTCTTNLLNYLQSNYPNASVPQILGGQSIVPATNATLSGGLLFAPTNLAGIMPVTNWSNIPTNMMSFLTISYATVNQSWPLPQLQGRRLALTANSSGSVQLWLEDSNAASGSVSGPFYVTVSILHPGRGGSWNYTNNTLVSGNAPFASASQYQLNSTYAILYAFDPDWGWLQEREQKLDAYLQAGYANTSRQVESETLNVMGLNWMLQTESMSQMLAGQMGIMPEFNHRIGRMAQEAGRGYYVDIFNQFGGGYPANPSSQSIAHPYAPFTGLSAYFFSAMEHGLIEQLQATNLTAASSVKILELANTNHQAVYLATSANWTGIESQLTNYSTSALYNGSSDPGISQGYALLLPQNGKTTVPGSNSWSGYGFIATGVTGDAAGATYDAIGPGTYAGGYVFDQSATINPPFVDQSAYTQPAYFSAVPPSLPSLTGADPVEMADGTFQVQASDLSLGGTEPRGLSLSRYYSSSRRSSNLAGLAPGWLHNYYLNAAMVSAPQAGLGGTTPAQAAALLVATTAAGGIYNFYNPDPKNWLVTDLIAKWGVDQLIARAVSVSLGQDTFQFIQQPDGSYMPPANCTMTLLQTNGAYWLQERHGRTYQFNGSGWATNIVDQYNQSLALTYNHSNLVQTVTDWKGRTLTFNYNSGTSNRLLSVSDSTGRTVGYGYSTSYDLASVTDPEGKISTFLCDTNHQITATFNALSQLVTSNVYNGFGRVTTQYTQGLTNKAWHIYWSGWETVSVDPAGGQQTYFYDDQTRLIGEQDALGNLKQSFYDGQDHTVLTVSPLNETRQFVYDGNNNLVFTVDPLGFTNQLMYDGQNNLVQAIDANGNPTTFGYNAQFSLTGQTNGAGDWVNYAYNADGTLHTKTDAGDTITYDYDGYGQRNSISDSLGGESFVNSALGDVTNHTDGRGLATSFQYNKRRQLLLTTATNNVTNSIAYDAVGNALTATDSRGNSLTNTWSATQHLLATALPGTLQGSPLVTNMYDSRDWLVAALDPYQKATLLTNDAAGRLIAVTDPLLRTSRMTYDADGRPLSMANAANETNRQTWNARGAATQQTDGAGHTITAVYDAAGNQTILTNRNQNPWQFKFDAANRLVSTVTPMGRSNVVVFNHQGLPVQITDQAGQVTTSTFDARGRLVTRTDGAGNTTNFYDGNNNLLSVMAMGQSNVWVYDSYKRISSYQDVNGYTIQYRYDANGNLTNLIYPGNRPVIYFYDNLNRLTNVTDWAQRKTTFVYDLASRLTGITRPNGTYRTISYDAAGQVTNVWEQMANTLPIAWFRFNWTNSGNLNWEFAAPPPHTNTPPLRTMTYDADNRLATFKGPTMGSSQTVSVDADGNLTSGPLTNDAFTNYVYDARNQLLNAGGVTNVYDAINNRVAQAVGTNTTTLVVNPNAALPQVLMRIKNGVTTYYIYGAGLMYQVTETATNTSTLTYHYDYRGSTIALSGDNGVPTDRVEYSLYGLTTYRTGTNDTPFLFNGQYGVQTDTNGLLYMRSRYYNPYLCRFINPDPSGFGGGLNMYAFANGNPVSYLDPYGLGAVGESALTDSYFNAPTALQTKIQNGLTDFASLVTLGTADFASSAINGTDLKGNNLDFGDAFQQELESGAFVASLALSLPTDGASLEADSTLFGGRLAADPGAGIKYIGKLDDLQGIPRSQTLLDQLPDLGSAKANYYQNSSVLRGALRDGYQIQDASAFRLNSFPDPTLLRPDRTVGQSFLGAERNILDNKGLILGPNGIYVPK